MGGLVDQRPARRLACTMLNPLSIAEAAAQISAGELTPPELIDRCLAQIRRHEDRVHAWVVVDEAGARQAAAELARQKSRGPLHGIPLGIKDIIDVAGLPTRAGSPLRAHHTARADSPLVAALRRAGAIILGKTVTVEFACFDPPPTKNPWDPALRHTPGGSSSGSAVAVALGMCPGAIGTQTGGSLVRPASYCGVAACKPTFGRVDRAGIVPVSYHLDHPGPIARRVADLQIMLCCLLDAPSREESGRPDESEISAPPRLRIVEQFFLEQADASIRKAFEAAVDAVRCGGADVKVLEFPADFAQIASMHRRIMAVEAAAYHRASFASHRESYGPKIAELLDEGLSIAAVDYADALAAQREFRRCVEQFIQADRCDALILPATDTAAPASLDTTGSSKFQSPWSFAGAPVVSIPCGLVSDGLPAAVQLVGRSCGDLDLLAVARWCERQFGFDSRPPAPLA